VAAEVCKEHTVRELNSGAVTCTDY